MTSMPSMYSTMVLFMAVLERTYWSKFFPLIWKVSAMQTSERGTVARDASARRPSMHVRAIKLTMGRARCPIPSGIMWARGGSMSSILSTIRFLISPMEWAATSPSGAWRNRSATRSRRPSRM